MPTDAGGTYTLPSGSAATTGTTILASEHNTPLNDVASALTARLPVDGSKGMSGALKIADGTGSSPSLAVGSETGTGFYKIGAGQLGLSIAGTATFTFDATGLSVVGGITYPKIQNVTSGALLGNFTGVLAPPAEITLGAGLTSVAKSSTVTITIASPGVVTWNAHGLAANAPVLLSTNGILPTGLSAGTVYYVVSPATNTFQLSATPGGSAINTTGAQSGTHTATSTTVIAAPAFPPPAVFKNLSIKVASNTTATLAADYIVVTNGTAFQTLAFNTTINMAVNGAAGLDTGTIAAATWYAVWAIAKPDGTASSIASTSATAPTLPSGYTYKARVGWLRTASGSAQLMGTWQLGRRAQYIVGLAQTSALPQPVSGSNGAPTAVSLVNYVPTATAASVIGSIAAPGAGGAGETVYIAPNASYGTQTSSSNPPPVFFVGPNSGTTGSASIPFNMMLEATTIYYTSNTATGRVIVSGWEDNL